MKTWEEWKTPRFGEVYAKDVRPFGDVAVAMFLWVPEARQHLRYVQIFDGQMSQSRCWRRTVAMELRRMRAELRRMRDAFLQEHTV